MKLWWGNQREVRQNQANTILVDRDRYEMGLKCAALLDAMLAHPIHAPDVERIIAEINPQAIFPGRAARQAETITKTVDDMKDILQ